jgi:tRNA(Ile)-lysidine synthase
VPAVEFPYALHKGYLVPIIPDSLLSEISSVVRSLSLIYPPKTPTISPMSFTAKITETITKYRMLSRGDGVLVAVSGGPDSVALLRVLWMLRNDFDLRLEVAHLEHGIRGEEAKEDARFVAEMADRLALPFHLREVEIPRLKAERGKGNLEAIGREERYRFFAEVAGERGLRKIATGHTRDDQAETVLMRLLRGSGRKGLGAMAPVSPAENSAALIRPLIETSRKEIEVYVAAEALPHRTDLTNLAPALLRNWVRLDLLPQLREKIDRNLDRRLARMADVLREEEQFFDNLTRSVFPKVKDKQGNLLRLPLLKQPKAMQRRLIRLWLEQALGNLRGVDFDHVEAVLALIADGPSNGRVAIPQGREVARSYDTLRVERKGRLRRASCCYSYALPLGGEIAVPEAGVKIEATRGSFFSAPRSEDSLAAVFDLKSLRETLTVRNFRAGDRFQPLGMRGHKKVKDLFIEKKVPLQARATLPLLVAGDEILWIPGCGRSETAKIGPATKEVLRIKLSALGDRNRPENSAES